MAVQIVLKMECRWKVQLQLFFAVIQNGRKANQHLQYPYMDNSAQLYSSQPPKLQGKLLHTSSVIKTPFEEVIVQIHQNFLCETSHKTKRYISFDFQLKFGFQLDPLSIFLERGHEKLTFNHNSIEDLNAWRDILRGRLNQRGFHEQFKPKKKIGKGNFASVYLAEKLESSKNFAVKAFSKEAAYSEEKGKECLIKEIEIMRSLDHKNCMRLFEVFQSDNSLYIVVELLQGGLLYDKVKSKYKFRPLEIKEIILSILRGLQEMHSKAIMHRDLKPQNLIFRYPGSTECVIADFGLSEFANAEEYLFVRCGTPGYVAPEVINIKDMKTKYHPICDMFSLGLIFHMMLLGVSAFPGKTYNEVLAQNRASNIAFEAPQYNALDQYALSLLKSLLQKNPEERITAEQALKHPYFADTNQDCEELDSVGELGKTSFAGGESPLLQSSNPLPKFEKGGIRKDSCLDFKMGGQNIFTGKVDTITETGSTANSVGKRFQSFVAQKPSKFTLKK